MSKEQNALKIIELICARFHLIAKQLKSRYSNRAPLEIKDEYDTQYLFHALLRIYFDDIRAEENVPSYAGSNSRVDFFLPKENTFIEVKKTRIDLKFKKLRKDLIEDIHQYQNHLKWHNLIFFIYDPEDLIKNPAGLENDLSKSKDGHNVKVFIRPKLYPPSTLDDQEIMTVGKMVDETEKEGKNILFQIIQRDMVEIQGSKVR